MCTETSRNREREKNCVLFSSSELTSHDRRHRRSMTVEAARRVHFGIACVELKTLVYLSRTTTEEQGKRGKKESVSRGDEEK